MSNNKTAYWQYTEKLLGQCAAEVAELMKNNPGYISGVTTTAEYRYLTNESGKYLDYNPNTILDFRAYVGNIEHINTIENFNREYGTSFTTFDLLSTDYDPSTVENAGGFDAPRNQDNAAFANLWTEFRAHQIRTAVQELVYIIEKYIDNSLIYTHQIAVNNFETASPIIAGDVEDSNIGIDLHNDEANEANIAEIRSRLGDDITRSWGVPEWLPASSDYNNTKSALERMIAADAKYIGPFNYGGNDEFDINTKAEVLRALTEVVTTDVTVSSYKTGDITDDGTVDILDLIRMKRKVEIDNSLSVNAIAADADGNSKVDGTDLVIVRKFLARR
ncbi:MAG: dockerin type I domain-containing protein [Faecalimonas sp.]|nr:dockerin type I domain-containing protein [Faecalimonas sp.]